MLFRQTVQKREKLVEGIELNLAEDLCKKCGHCCHAKVWQTNHLSCKYLVGCCEHLTKEGLCSVYTRRHEVAPNCVTIREALLSCILPAQCSYVQKNWEQIKNWYLLPDENLLNK